MTFSERPKRNDETLFDDIDIQTRYFELDTNRFSVLYCRENANFPSQPDSKGKGYEVSSNHFHQKL